MSGNHNVGLELDLTLEVLMNGSGKRRNSALSVALAAVCVAAMLVGGCAKQPVPTSSGPQSTLPTGGPQKAAHIEVFLLQGETPASVARTAQTDGAQEALVSLMRGPTDAEKQQGLTTAIPAGTRLNSYAVSDGVAHVDFSAEMKNYGGGSTIVQEITEQVTRTVTANDDRAKSVAISVDGVPAEEAIQP